MLSSAANAGIEGLFSDAGDAVSLEEPGAPDATGAESGLRKRNVRIDLDRLAGIREDIDAQRAAPAVVLNLLEDVRFRAVFEDATPTLWGYSLSGRLEGERFGTVTLVVNGDIVAGTVRTLTATYSIRSVGVGVHVVEEVEPPTLDEDDAIVPPASAVSPAQPFLPSSASAEEDDGSEIDVFVFYTNAVRDALNGMRSTRAQIDLAVTETNAAYEASGAAQRIRLVGAVETRYEDIHPSFTDLDRLRDAGDGYMDEVHLIRDAYAADLVHLLTEKGGSRGWLNPYDDTFGFAQTAVGGKRLPSRVFAHELGHNMGLHHDRYELLGMDLNWPTPYSHGYVNQAAFADDAPAGACWYTIMAYFNQCGDAGLGGPSLMRFSNPNQYYPDADGDPMGIPGEDPSEEVDGPADAVRSLNETRTSVANFRASANRCSYRLTRADDERIAVGVDGGSFTVGVEFDEGCPVGAISHDEFVELVTRPTDEGVEVAFEVAGNDGGARIGLITIMGESVEILQRGGATVEDVCGRSPWMRDILTDYAGRESCDEVTEFDLAEIYQLSLFGHGITGSIEPNDFEGLVNLRVLGLRSTRLSGPIPAEVGGLRNLRELYLYNNELSGPIPPALGQLDLRLLEISGNAFTGPIPPELGALENLSGSLLLDHNRLSGPIPEELGNLRNAWAISLAGNALTGDIPRALGSLDGVRELHLHDNQLTGTIPRDLGNLTKLQELRLRDNRLTGDIPAELSVPEDLRVLHLAGNSLTGCIPGALRDVADNDVDQLGLGYCAAVSLAHGGSPDAPGEAGRVVEGSAASLTIVTEPEQDTAFDVTVMVSGGEAFGVARGNRTVTIPSGTTKTTLFVNTENDDLEELDGAFTATILADAGFALMMSRSSASIIIDDDEGPSAPTIASLTPEDGMLTVTWTAPPGGSESVSEYHIRYRPTPPAPGWQTWKRMSHETGGVLQRDITGLTNRVEYDVQVRTVSADGDGTWSDTAKGTPRTCPDHIELGDCRALLAVRDTLVGGGTGMNWAIGLPIEEWIGIEVTRFTGRVVEIRLSGQGLGGTIPAELGSLTELTVLSLPNNRLTGMIPPQLGNLPRLRELSLGINRLTGTIPPELGDLRFLRTLSLFVNEFTGTIPPELGRLVNLRNLYLADSGLTGPIPEELGGLANLVTLWLHNNQLTGPIPSDLGLLEKLETLQLSRNRLTGTIPGSMRNLTNLTRLSLTGNQLTGPIPSDLGLLEKLETLRLSRNRLTGTIPGSMRNLTNLTRLFLAGNQLTGCVPAALRDVEQNDLHQLNLADCPPGSVIDLLIESSPLDGRAYGAGEPIEASIWFETDVTVSGSPQLVLMIGFEVRGATFIANRGDGGLGFRYVVGPGDRDSDGISIAPDALTLNGGRIRDVDGEDAVLDLGEHAVANHPFHQVRGALRELVPDQELETGGESLTLDLSRYFEVPKGGTLTYGSPKSSDPTVVTAVIEDGLLKIMPQEGGVATITVTATDHNGITVTLSFRVTVTATMHGLRPWLMGILAEQEAAEVEDAEANDPQ